ncbi:MAG TPA: hypothetical protein PLB88_04665 [Thermoanaerobaculaceae bacterium]|nr:hypothetical protein [Thermoanaerobaculaceae bacterium]
MTTPLATPPSAPDGPPLLRPEDLDDPARFLTLRKVPVFAAHDDPDAGSNLPADKHRGDVRRAKLVELARNTNARTHSRGKFMPAKLQIGHTLPKKPLVVKHEGQLQAVASPPEGAQPFPVGYATNWWVGDPPGGAEPELYCDWHIHQGDVPYTRTFPYSSIEREPEEYISAVALLRTEPALALATMHYGKRLADAEPEAEGDAPASGPAVAPDSATDPDSPAPKEDDMATAPTAAAAEPAGGIDYEKLAQVFAEALAPLHEAIAGLHEAIVGGDEPPPEDDQTQYADPDPEPDADGDGDGDGDGEPELYDKQGRRCDAHGRHYASEPGATNTYMPSDGRPPKEYERDRRHYAKFQTAVVADQGEQDVLILDTLARLERMEQEKAREQTLRTYAKDLEALAETHVIDLDAELQEVPLDGAEAFITARKAQVVRCYAKRHGVVPTIRPNGSAGAPAKPTAAQARQILQETTSTGCSVEAAKAKLGF